VPDKPELPTMLGRYRVLGTIGKGGMGIVFKGFHLNLERDVAIKTMRIDKINTPDVVSRFRQEIKLIGQMDHDNVVRATDAGEKNGVFYLVMEFLSGRDLSKLVALNGPLGRADACELTRQAALGLEYIHQTLVHRDIKPSNLMLTTTGQVKILDLGLAHYDQNESEDHNHTPAGVIMGTRFYMAPEQARGSRTIDGRADIYSLGSTLFKLVTGKEPYSGPDYGNSASQLYAHCHVPLTSAPAFELIPEELRPVLLRMMAKDPAERYQSGREVAEALAPFAVGSAPALLGAAGEGEPKVQPLMQPLPEELSRLTQSVVETPRDTPTVSTVTIVPRRKLSVRKLAVVLAASVLAAGLVWLGVAFYLREIPPEDGIQSLDDSPLHSFVYLLKRRPFPVGFSLDDPRSGAWHRGGERLDVPGPLDHFLLLGATERSHFDFEAVIEQAPWSGYVGIFWGYQENSEVKEKKTPNEPFARFQCLHILHAPDDGGKNRYVAQRNKGTLHYSKTGNVASRLLPPSPSEAVKGLSGKVRLKIEVAANRLVLVEVGGERISGLYSASSKTNDFFASEPYQGRIGVFTLGNAATFSDVRFMLKSKS
jgi:serine/threonine protein kinase